MTLAAGTRLGPYEISAPLGAGGMGEVYRARDTRLGREVAVKVLSPRLSDSGDFKARFEREARAISSLQHPNICVLHDVGRDPASGVDYLVMEFLDGESLASRLRRGALPLPELLKIALEIADALERAHRAGIIHRDLKPGNIMLTKSGAKLLDFGLAKAAAAGVAAGASLPLLSAAPTLTSPTPQPSPITGAGSLVGTVQYMSPEQLQGEEADARSDIFAFGAVLYEMACGRRAFEGKSQISVASAILEKDPPLVSSLKAASPPALDQIIATCLAKEPEDRFACVHDVKLQLAAVRATAAPPRQSSRAAWIVAGAAVLIAAALAFAQWRQSSTPALLTHTVLLPPDNAALTTNGFLFFPPVISPDGRRLAYTASVGNGASMLWVQSLATAKAQPVEGTEGAEYPFWSPDGRQIGYFSISRAGTDRLFRVNSEGGPVQLIGTLDTAVGGAWNADGDILYGRFFNGPLSRVPASGGTASPVTEVDSAAGETRHSWPQFLPDGKHFLYLGYNLDATKNAVYVGSLDSKQRTLLLRHATAAKYAAPGYLLFVRDGTLLAQPFSLRTFQLSGVPQAVASDVGLSAVGVAAFDVSSTGTLVYRNPTPPDVARLVWNAPDPTAGQAVVPGSAEYGWPVFSPDDRRIAVPITESGKSDVWVIDLQRQTRTRVTTGPGQNWMPSWWPDGRSIAFVSDREGIHHIYRKAADGSGAEETLLASKGTMEMIDGTGAISGDGRFIAFTRQGSGPTGFDVWVLPTFGDRKPMPFAATEFSESSPAFSPDGKWIAYVSNASGADEVYVRPFPAADRQWQISTSGGFDPSWSADGKRVFFKQSVKPLEGPALASTGREPSIFAVELGSQGGELTVGTPRLVASTRAGARALVVSRDGKRFISMEPTARSAPQLFHVLQNWTAALNQ